MGMFDSVDVQCPKCESMIEFQSKAGECLLNNYSLYNAPPEVLEDISRDIEVCPNCKSAVGIKLIMVVRSAQAFIQYKDEDEAWENGE